MTPSDFRCAMAALAPGLLLPPSRDDGCADGPLVFRDDPCTRAAPHTPPRSSPRSGARAKDVAFAAK